MAKSACVQCFEASKYRCPRCHHTYCSVPCYIEHRKLSCKIVTLSKVTDDTKPMTEYQFLTADTVPKEKLEQLVQSPELKKCLEDPYLRQMLVTLDSANNPDALIQEYMQDSCFTEFVDSCLGVVDPSEDGK